MNDEARRFFSIYEHIRINHTVKKKDLKILGS